MTVENVIAPLIRGLVNGSLIALIALGYTLVYGIVELINFAHGDVFMIGALTGLSILTAIPGFKSGQPVRDTPFVFTVLIIIIVIVIAMALCAALNFVIDRFAYRPLRNAPRLAPLITAIGVSFMLQNVGLFWRGSRSERYPIAFPNEIGNANLDILSDVLGIKTSRNFFPFTALLILIVAIPLFFGLRYLIYSTKVGRAMRSVAQNGEAAALMGVNINRTISVAFLLGGALAGVAGVVYGLYNGSVRYDLGFQNGLFAFTAAVLGGIGNINGAVLGGFFIGMISAIAQSNIFGLTSGTVSFSEWAPALVFGILVIVLIFKPSGLLGENVPEKV